MVDDLNEQDIPTLIKFLFGEKAKLAVRASGPRLLRWCQAFEDWLDDRRARCQPNTYRKSLMIWERFLERMRKYPWDIGQEEVKAYIAWMQEKGLAASSIKYELNVISRFYAWCREHQIDGEHGEILDPSKGAARPKVRNYGNAKVLNAEEARALLEILRRDEAILTKRDYAFFLARLRLGVPLRRLQQLRWGESDDRGPETDDRGKETEDEGGSRTMPLPRDVYEAIVDYLRAAGRLEGMRAEAYVFAPLADPLRQETCGRAEDWDEGRYVGHKQIWRTLKRYGRLAGIADEKLTLQALRHTAAMLRVEAGDSLEEIQAFLEGPPQKFIKSYLKGLPPPDANAKGLRDLEEDPPRYPEREPNKYQPWEGMIHGMAARYQPPEEVAAVLAEDIRGMEEEIVGVRILNRGLLEMQQWTSDPMEVALVTDAYSRAAMRLSKMFETEEAMNKGRPEEDWTEQFLANLAEGARERGEILDIEREKALALGGEEVMAANARRRAEEIAGMRVALRRTFQQALESETVRRRVYLTDVYGQGCRRLVKLLSLEGEIQTRLKIYLNQMIDEVILAIQQEWGLK